MCLMCTVAVHLSVKQNWIWLVYNLSEHCYISYLWSYMYLFYQTISSQCVDTASR